MASANSVAEIRCNQYGVSSIIPEEFPSNDSIYTPKDSIQHKLVAVENNDSILPDTCKQPCIETEYYLADNEQTSKKHQWQLLAAGSLGSALAQNAYKLFVGNASSDDGFFDYLNRVEVYLDSQNRLEKVICGYYIDFGLNICHSTYEIFYKYGDDIKMPYNIDEEVK